VAVLRVFHEQGTASAAFSQGSKLLIVIIRDWVEVVERLLGTMLHRFVNGSDQRKRCSSACAGSGFWIPALIAASEVFKRWDGRRCSRSQFSQRSGRDGPIVRPSWNGRVNHVTDDPVELCRPGGRLPVEFTDQKRHAIIVQLGKRWWHGFWPSFRLLAPFVKPESNGPALNGWFVKQDGRPNHHCYTTINTATSKTVRCASCGP